MKHWQRLLGTTALLLSLTACNELGQCEKAAIGEGLRTTVYNPDGIYHGFPGNGHAYGDTCRVFANGSFTPVEGVEGLYRYAPPPGLRVLTGGWYCSPGTLVRLSDDTRRPYQEEILADLRACHAIRAASK